MVRYLATLATILVGAFMAAAIGLASHDREGGFLLVGIFAVLISTIAFVLFLLDRGK